MCVLVLLIMSFLLLLMSARNSLAYSHVTVSYLPSPLAYPPAMHHKVEYPVRLHRLNLDG